VERLRVAQLGNQHECVAELLDTLVGPYAAVGRDATAKEALVQIVREYRQGGERLAAEI
jgi:hypothetical protein